MTIEYMGNSSYFATILNIIMPNYAALFLELFLQAANQRYPTKTFFLWKSSYMFLIATPLIGGLAFYNYVTLRGKLRPTLLRTTILLRICFVIHDNF